jgi:hypothetical protein
MTGTTTTCWLAPIALALASTVKGSVDPLPALDGNMSVLTRAQRRAHATAMEAAEAELYATRTYLDSGATIDVDNRRAGMRNYKEVTGLYLSTAQANARVPVAGLGDRTLGGLSFKDIRHVPTASKNLRSVSKLCDQANGTYEVLFTSDGFEVRDTPCTCTGGRVVGLGYRVRDGPDANMYVHATPKHRPKGAHDGLALNAQDDRERADDANREQPNKTPEVRLEGASTLPQQAQQAKPQEKVRPTKAISTIHSAYGHLNLAALQLMNRANVLSLPTKMSKHLMLTTHLDCEHCQISKTTQSTVNKQNKRRATRPGERLMADIRGPFKVESTTRSQYYLNIVDDFSAFSTIIPLRDKNDAQSAVLDYLQYVTTQGHTTKVLQTDNDGAIVDAEVKKALKKAGITYDPSPPYKKELNGAAERDHRTLGEGTLALLHQARMPLHYWQQALLCKNYVKNRTINASLPPTTNAATIWFQRVKEHHPFLPFGCGAKSYVYPEERKKDDPKLEEDMIMVGYGTRGAYLLLRGNGNIVARYGPDIIFNPNVFPYPEVHAAARKQTASAKKPDDDSTTKLEDNNEPRRSKRTTYRPSDFASEELDAKATKKILAEYKAGTRQNKH